MRFRLFLLDLVLRVLGLRVRDTGLRKVGNGFSLIDYEFVYSDDGDKSDGEMVNLAYSRLDGDMLKLFLINHDCLDFEVVRNSRFDRCVVRLTILRG